MRDILGIFHSVEFSEVLIGISVRLHAKAGNSLLPCRNTGFNKMLKNSRVALSCQFRMCLRRVVIVIIHTGIIFPVVDCFMLCGHNSESRSKHGQSDRKYKKHGLHESTLALFHWQLPLSPF